MNDRKLAITLTLFLTAVLLGLYALTLRKPMPRQRIAANQPIQFRIDPNTADTDTLCILPMIGPSNAQHIVDDREINGPFHDAQDMQRVRFVGEKTVIAIEPWLVFKPTQ